MALPFHNVRMPENVEQGATGGPGFHTSILELSSGEEQRNIDWSKQRGNWDVGFGLQPKTLANPIIAFFYARRGKGYGFRFKDWSDFQLDNDIGTGDAATTVFQIIKRYSSGGVDYDRKITRIVNGTLQVYVDDVLKTVVTDYTVNQDTGLLTLGTPPGTKASGVLTSSANYSDGETVTIGSKVYTLQNTLTNVDGHVKIGGSEAATILNLHHAINHSGGVSGTDYAAATTANTQVTATDDGVHALTVTAILSGIAGDAIATTETSATASWAHPTLIGGVAGVVSVVCEFDVPVRFNTDQLVITAQTAEALAISSLPLMELKE